METIETVKTGEDAVKVNKMIGLRITEDIRRKINFIGNYKMIMGILVAIFYIFVLFYGTIRPAIRFVPYLLRNEPFSENLLYFINAILSIVITVAFIISLFFSVKSGMAFKKSLLLSDEIKFKEAFIHGYSSSKIMVVIYILAIISFIISIFSLVGSGFTRLF